MTRRIREMVARGQQDFEANLNAHQESLWHDWDAALPDHLYHYTTLTGMQGILEAGVCWATDIRHMNDTTEGTYAVDLVQEVLAGRTDVLSRGLLENFRQRGGMPGNGTEWFQYAVCFCGAGVLSANGVATRAKAQVWPSPFRPPHSCRTPGTNSRCCASATTGSAKSTQSTAYWIVQARYGISGASHKSASR